MRTTAPPRLTRRQVRDLQRAAHLVAGVVLVGCVYAGPLLGAEFLAFVRWVVIPVLVGSGITLWKWPRIRTMLRGRN